MKKTLTSTITAWLTEANIPHMDSYLKDGSIHNLTLSNCDMSSYNWVNLGKATVTLEVDVDMEGLQLKAVDVLNDAIRNVQADAEKKINQFREQISKLTSIGYEAPIDSNIIEA